ncbi:hypothetical protein [Fibrella forsythiae]|uniref:LPXTG cell wall anchor domain-containing protein n=1 Tax=Fibrella forsythiae TaxID=2817061 RepID=A0ABS3JMJ1_9BACT|nr:hypothetical protein [Fibrella forsythiae]MBO0951222.1 hypothetical protein [Fibrella forsythiae]
MAFTSEKKFGYSDGQHVGWYGDGLAIFVRVQNGTVRTVGKEMNPAAANPQKIGKLARSWMKYILPAIASDFDNFVAGENENGAADTSEPYSAFVITLPVGSAFIRPNLTATTTPGTTTPGTTTPGTTTPGTTTPGTTTGSGLTDTGTGGTTGGTTTTKKMNWKTIGIVTGAVVVVVVVGYYAFKKKAFK